MTPANRALALGLAAFAMVVAASLSVIATRDVPDYGAWTGIRPLERKVELLAEFASRGPVDAIALGSSIVDFGFSAEVFSRLMSAHLGREWRMYNFASGGAEPRTLPKLYRFARLASKPKEVFVIVPPEPRLRDYIYARSPDYILERAPVGSAVHDQHLLAASRVLWKLPFLRNAPAVRDLVLFGNYRNIQSSVAMEAYSLSPHGDHLSYLTAWNTAALLARGREYEKGVAAYPAGSDPGGKLGHYFARIDALALAELRELVREDGGRIVLLSHAAASVYWQRERPDPAFVAVRRDFYETMAAELGAPWWDVTDRMSVPTYAVSDETHLNVFGADHFTRAAFAAYTGTPYEPDAVLREGGYVAPVLDSLPKDDATMNPYAAIVLRPAGEAHRELRVRIVRSLAVPPVPAGLAVLLALRFPDGSDRTYDVREAAPGEYAIRVDLPAAPEAQVLVARVLVDLHGRRVALNNPVAGYAWAGP